jgi:mediator of RNA polymerase II transcription subunit 12
LFSIASNPSEWLVLMHREKAITAQAANTSATTSDGPKNLEKDRITPFPLRRWEMLGEPTPNVGENDTCLSLTLFAARKG